MNRRTTRHLLTAAALLLGAGGAVVAQIEGGDRGVAPVSSSGDYEVSGVQVDVSARNAEDARQGGWRLAQRRAWQTLSKRLGSSGALIPDGTLDQLVSGIVVENEQIGPTRYIARLGVLFNRERAASLLGVAAYISRSPPMLVLPVQWSGGVGQVFETRTEWQQAWARYRTGNSSIDYVRPSGSGADPLLLNAGQAGRRGRLWWRTVLDQYGAEDVLIPTVRLYRQWPGGPVIGVFQARHGPDSEFLQQFILRVGNEDGIPQLLDVGVKRIDDIYQTALTRGYLRPDPSLSTAPPSLTPVPTPTPTPTPEPTPTEEAAPAATATTLSLQYDSPGAAAVANTEALVRGLPSVRSALTTSLALGGVSVMRVTVDDPEALRAALQARGYQVLGTGTTLRIRRVPQLLPPELQPDNATAG